MMQEIMRADPFRELSRGFLGEGGNFVPSFEVKETKDSFIFKADLPGLKEDDLEVSLSGNILTISGQRQEEKKDEGERYYAYERSYGSFTRSFTLPDGVDPEHVQAELKDGVLTLVAPKKPEVQPKRIDVKGTGTGAGGEKKAKA
jgi:HSP20 family protein